MRTVFKSAEVPHSRRQTGEGSSAEHSAEPGASAPGEPKKRMTPTAEELGKVLQSL